MQPPPLLPQNKEMSHGLLRGVPREEQVEGVVRVDDDVENDQHRDVDSHHQPNHPRTEDFLKEIVHGVLLYFRGSEFL